MTDAAKAVRSRRAPRIRWRAACLAVLAGLVTWMFLYRSRAFARNTTEFHEHYR